MDAATTRQQQQQHPSRRLTSKDGDDYVASGTNRNSSSNGSFVCLVPTTNLTDNDHRDGKEDDEDDALFNGFPRMFPYMICGYVLLSAVYVALDHRILPRTSALVHNVAPEFCGSSTGKNSSAASSCSRPDLFAFQVASGLAIAACGYIGIRSWYFGGGAGARAGTTIHTRVPPTPAGRLFAYVPEAETLAAINCTFQFWDFCISAFVIPEHGNSLMLAHHLGATAVSYCSIRYGVLQYYGIFFLGLSEVSSIFLVFVDLAKYFPPQSPGSSYDLFIQYVANPGFALTFILYRFLYWWPISYQLFTDVYAVSVQSNQAQRLRPGKVWVLYVFLFINLPLGLLQLYWMTIIAAEVQKVLFPTVD
jgi:TLC domain